MRGFLIMLLMWLVNVPGLCQRDSPRYQPGTILSVERTSDVASKSGEVPIRYKVSIRIDDTVYVVLYTPPFGSNAVEYSPGMERLFSVGTDSLRYPEREGYAEMPILRTTKVSAEPSDPATVWSKAPGQYFSLKMKNLCARLNLNEGQQAKVKPIAEQESAEAGSVIFTTVVSRQERLSQWEKIVRASDAKMKPILSEAQWQKLQEVRKDQKRELKELIAKQDEAERK